eukprot:4229081-Amphidinium_carterae.1
MTKSRGCHGFFVTRLHGMMTLEEVMLFQGYNPGRLSWKTSSVPRGTWAASMGDGMSLNVLQKVLKRGMKATGLA